jgi:hypothetical protein
VRGDRVIRIYQLGFRKVEKPGFWPFGNSSRST